MARHDRQPRSRDYTAAERATLATLYPAAPRADVLAALPGRSWHSIGVAASELRVRRNTTWPADAVARLVADYSLRGGAYVARVLGKDPESVAKKAYALGLKREHFTPEQRMQRKADYRARARAVVLAARAGQPAPPRAAALPRPAPAARPVAGKAAPLLAVKRSGGTPVLNVAKETRRRAELAAKKAVGITADEIRKLPANHPARYAYAMGGALGWQLWNAQQAA